MNTNHVPSGGPEAPPRIHPDVLAQRLGDRTVLIHLTTNRIYELNQTATRLWDLLADGLGRPAIIQRMLAEYEIGEDALAAEVDAFLGRLAADGFVT